MKGIQQGTEQHNQLFKKSKFSPRDKTNSLEDEFVPLRENDAERTTSQWGRFISPRENDAGRFKACSLRKRACSLRGKSVLLMIRFQGKSILQGKR